MFSQVASRLDADTNPLYRMRDELTAGGQNVLDLITGNVGEAGILFPQDTLERIWIAAARASRIYRPDSFGQRPARDAVSAYYESHGTTVPPENIILTPGTSLSYWYCFKLLANDGDEILCPRPSYPLFDYIAALSGITLAPYDLMESRGWEIDLDRLEANISTRTRALVLISPHNPTGHVSSARELAALAEVATRHDLAIISDEVFSEFMHTGDVFPRPAEGSAPLIVTLNGFSKMFALPGMKLGWMALSGYPDVVRRARRALELISDTFLPVNEAVQAAVPLIFEEGQPFLRAYAAAVRRRWVAAERILGTCNAVSFVPPAGGFYVTVRLAAAAEDRAATQILSQELCLVHPGYYYDVEPDHLVLSFTHEEEIIREAFPRVLAALESHSSRERSE
jgi:alanine-synthesizing transaminase